MSYHIFERWPFTSIQNLNLDWILNAVKEAVTTANEAAAKADSVEAEVGTYSQRLSNAEAEADSARNTANTARAEALNAQSDATSGIAIGQAAQSTANTAQSTANTALSIANTAADSADTAVDSATDAARDAATALQLANLASEDYLNIGITVYPSNPAQATKNADEILAAVTANKKIKFTVDDARTGETHTTYNYTINPVDNTTSDIDINVIFDISVSSALNKYIIVTFHKVVSGGNTTYSISSTDVSFSGDTQIVWGYQDEDQGNSVIRRKSDDTIYTPAQMLADESAGKLVLVESTHGIFYLSGASSALASFFNGGTLTMTVASNGQYTEIAVPTGGAEPVVTNTNTNVQLSLSPNTFYIFPNAAQLSISFTAGTAGVVNEYHFRFTSGSTATQLDLPATVEIPDDFDVAADTVYEISIVDNYMVYSSWAVSA